MPKNDQDIQKHDLNALKIAELLESIDRQRSYLREYYQQDNLVLAAFYAGQLVNTAHSLEGFLFDRFILQIGKEEAK